MHTTDASETRRELVSDERSSHEAVSGGKAAGPRALAVRRTIAALGRVVGYHKRRISAIALASIGAGLAEAVVLSLIAYIAATMSSRAAGASIDIGPVAIATSTGWLIAIAAGLAIVRLLLQLVLVRLPARLTAEVQSGLRTKLVDAFLSARWQQKADENEGRLTELTGGQAAHAAGVILMLAGCLAAALEFVILVVAAMVLNVGVSIVVIATAGGLFVCLRPLTHRVRGRSAATSAALVTQAREVAKTVRMAEEMQVFGVTERQRSRLRELVLAVEKQVAATKTLSRLVPVLYQSAVIVLILGGLGVLYFLGEGRLAALGAAVLLLVRASSYGQQLQVAYQGVVEAVPYADRVIEAIRSYEGQEGAPGHCAVASLRSVEFDHVSFEYRRDVPVLRNVTFSIRAGETVGVMGPSGAGKSTLLHLLLRLRQPTGGRYLVNGFPAEEVLDDQWHEKVAFLPQEPHLVDGTVADNIRFFREWIDDHTIRRAARLSHIDEDISSWAAGYETVIGHRSNAISGGQRQRICLARALAGTPEMLLLDEPTSALDIRSERLIQESLAELSGDLILIVVAHRVTTLNLCDRVMVIRDGYLESFAPAELLYHSNDFYRRSVDMAAGTARPGQEGS